MKLIFMVKIKKPKFLRWRAKNLKKLGMKWRKPRGHHSKQRKRKKGRPKMPSPGYGAPKRLRGLHPSGFREVLVSNHAILEKMDSKIEAARISGSVGKKKRDLILKRAEELKIKVLNP